jgi:hypothetical protein
VLNRGDDCLFEIPQALGSTLNRRNPFFDPIHLPVDGLHDLTDLPGNDGQVMAEGNKLHAGRLQELLSLASCTTNLQNNRDENNRNNNDSGRNHSDTDCL